MKESRLKPYLSVLPVWALSFGCAVGWGAFAMPGNTFLPMAGPMGTVIGFFAGAVLMLVIGGSYFYMMKTFPDAGGTYSYTKQLFGYDHGFLASWFLILTYVAIVWANMTALALILRTVFGGILQFGFHYTIAGFDVYFGEVLMELSLLLLVCGICAFSKRGAVMIQTVAAVILFVGVLLAFITVYSRSRGVMEFTPGFQPGNSYGREVFSIMLLTPWAFIGFESISHSVEEFKFPVKKSIVILTVSVVSAFAAYVLPTLMAASQRPVWCGNWKEYIDNLGNLEGVESMPVFHSVYAVTGEMGLYALGVVVFCGILTGMIGNIIASTRLMYAMAKDDILPAWFQKTDKNGNPRNAVFFIFLLSLLIPFVGRTAIGWIVDVTTFGATFTYGYTSAATFIHAKRQHHRRGTVVGLLGFLSSIIFGLSLMLPNFMSVSALAAESYLILAVWSILGFAFFWTVFRRDKNRRFGKQTVSWIALLFLIFFTSLMWTRQAMYVKTESVLSDIRAFYVREMEEHNVVLDETGLREESDYLETQMSEIRRALMKNSEIQMILIMMGLLIMFNIYSIIRRRERKMESEKIEAEAERIRAEQSSKAKSTFLSNMSHDIRTPMNAIVGYINLSKREDITQEEMQSYLDKIESSSQHLLALINDILEMSRIESGRMELEIVPTNLRELMDGAFDMFQTQMETKKIHYTVAYDEVRNFHVICDKNRLNRVLLNLISNAYKFTPEDGEVQVRLKEVQSADPEKYSYILSVRDSGIGMSPEFAEKVFEAFERERTSTVSGIQGTGLGMAITKSIVDLMGGTIEVNTAPGEGAEFVATLSFKKGQAPEIEETQETTEEERAVDFTRKRLLLVEDIEINREIALMILGGLGFSVETAVNGREAVDKVEAAESGHFDAVMMDIQMPVMNGYEAAAAIRRLSDPKKASIPIVAMTADAFNEDVKKAIEAGMDAHVAKPIDVKKQKKTMTAILSGESEAPGGGIGRSDRFCKL